MEFFFCIGWKPEQFDKLLKRFPGNFEKTGDQIGRTIRTYYGNVPCILIWVKNKRNYAAIAHECLHAVNFVFDHVGVKPSYRNDEPQAYFLSELVWEATT